MAIASETQTEFTQFALALAEAGGKTALEWFRKKYTIEHKSDKSPVTVADKTTETCLREMIRAHYPEHGVLGEEFGDENGSQEYVWSLDPIDGTRSFITGSPLWGTIVALVHNGSPITGVVRVPAMDECWWGSRGCGAWSGTAAEKKRAEVSACTDISTAKFYTTSPYYFSAEEKPAVSRVIDAAQEARFGGDCYSYCLLASGYVDLIVESCLHYFDYMPLIPIIEEAGGLITDWQGQPLHMESAGQVVAAATPELHRQALELLAGKGA